MLRSGQLDRLRWFFLLSIFQLAYGRFAWAYDYLTERVFAGYWRRWQELGLKELRGENVLEIGFGTGHLLRLLSHLGFRVYGADLSTQLMVIAKKKLLRAGSRPRLVRASAQFLPFRDSCFDNVLVTFPAPWIRSTQAHKEIARVLRPGGRLVVVDAAELTGTSCRWRIRRLLLRSAYGQATGRPDYLDYSGFPLKGKWERATVGESFAHVFTAQKASACS